MPKVLMIVGSLRERSLNRQVAKQAEALVGDRAEVAWLDYAGIPFMNQDIESPVPAQIQRVRDEVLAANGIWIATAEYNSNIPGPLKNLLDWLSRPMDPADRHSPSAIKGKPVAISGAAGKSAASGVRGKLAEMLGVLGCTLVGDEGVGIALDGQAFATNELALSEEDLTALGDHVEMFLAALEG